MKNSSCSFIEGNKNIALKYSSDNGQAMPAEIINLMGTGEFPRPQLIYAALAMR